MGTQEKNLGRARIAICDRNGTFSQSREEDVDLREYERMRTIRRYSNFPMREAGQHWFCVELKDPTSKKWNEVARIPLKITFQDGSREKPGKVS
jgi:hypothetical protein